ncbi:MAG: extracellular solute-binding protein, partial [Caldilineales bacterium]|nr:extracellular solute-binding protein [Caldilineales bacterium]
MKRNLLIVVFVLIAALLLAACATAAPAPAPAPAATEAPAAEEPAAEPTEAPAEEPATEAAAVELYHDKASWDPNFNLMGEMSATDTGVGFTGVPFADTTNYQTTVRAALGTDSAPDLYTWWSGYRMEDIVKAGVAADLTAVWDKYLASGEYSQGVANAFAFDGKVYAVPSLTANWVVYYNKNLFEENGWSVPTNWDEFTALNDALVEKGITPMAVTIDGRWPAFIMFEEMVLRTAGPEFYNKLVQGEAKYTDPEVVNALTLWKEMIEKGYFTDPGIPFGTGENAILPLFQSGQVAMIPIGDWYSTTLVGGGLVPGEDYDAFIMPNQNSDLPAALFFEAGPLLVGEKSPNKENAIKVADWWMSVGPQNKWSELNGFTSGNANAELANVVGAVIQQWIADINAEFVQRYWEATPPDIAEFAVDELGPF